ncbi:hypothetical protein BJ878DRAFT_275062 [Calycina marina]|uniref:SEC7 domain-containing protein n=1 Tax=Calycina marina TaxID=1763456 RepID=A0A9P7YWI3_9HELO|nr:hypothetical protein BJ878DRAFT_275062 [Calycina marina]
MQSYENSPLTPTSRHGLSLNVNTTNVNRKGKDASPQTPKGQHCFGKDDNNAGQDQALRELKMQNSPRQTFLDDTTPVDRTINRDIDADRGRQGKRDSHDLQLSPRQITRDSLVDNMLLSLDQFAFESDIERQPTAEEEAMYSNFGEEESYRTAQNFAPRHGRGVPGHNYSYSSDCDNGDNSSRYSEKDSRGRRSNSTSNFQTAVGRLNSLRNEPIISNFAGRGPAGQIPPRGMHSRNGKGSKGSSTTNFDIGYAQVTSNQRWVHGLPGRSSSFDFGEIQSPQSMTRSTTSNGPAFIPYDYDAAPTPTVPGGPRRARPASPIILSQHEPRADPLHKLERKRSTRSSKSAYKSKADYGLHDRSRELPPMPAFLKEQSAPASPVGYEKAKVPPSGTPPTKERPGFFRRVFGSSKSTPIEASNHGPNGSTTSAETPEHTGIRQQHIATQMKPQHAIATTPRVPPPASKETPHVLSKKPSSFFRRRKKSVSEPEPPVALPVVPPIRYQELGLAKANSPVSSLRKVMNPYLRNAPKSPLDPMHNMEKQMSHNSECTEPEPSQRNFSPDYQPSPNATIRTVRQVSKDDSETEDSRPNSKSTQPPSRRHLRHDAQLKVEGGTFLQDSSDNDRDVLSSKPEQPSSKSSTPATVRSATGPSPAIARDMALVAEYERTFSRRSPTATKSGTPKTSSAIESPLGATKSKDSRPKDKVAVDKDDWIVLTPTKLPEETEKEHRVWLEPSSSEEDITVSKLELPIKRQEEVNRQSGSTVTTYQSATSLPKLQIEGEDHDDVSSPIVQSPVEINNPIVETPEDITKPTDSDRGLAQRIYDGNEDFVSKDKAATWLGEGTADRTRTLVAYMELYDFTDRNVLVALRNMCSSLVLKAESQQVDRILVAFANRWCQCNPKHGFKHMDVVHTITYSLLLLNTDLHMADIDQKMTRSQFVKNTMPTIRMSMMDNAPDTFDARPSVLPGKSQTFDVENPKSTDGTLRCERKSIETERPSWRSSFKPPARVNSDGPNGIGPTPLEYDTPNDDCGPLVKAPFIGTARTWEVQVEIVLKDFYNSLRTERLPLFGAPIGTPKLPNTSASTLSVFTNGMLRRSPSVLSKAPSDSQSFARSRTGDGQRAGTTKWTAKGRTRPRLYPNSGLGSSRTSLDDQSSMWSQSLSSSTLTKYSLGKTHTSMSVDSLGSTWGKGEHQRSIGFANAIGQAIIREEAPTGVDDDVEGDDLRVAPLLEDESLELAGAPWAKEGILKHKHHLEALDKKSKDRNWNEVFAVIEKGYMSLFSFSSKSMKKTSRGKATGGVVGGGNWQDNAESLGSFLLRQTIASALPPPGYSKSRPHVWALSLPTGAVHLFQVGTPDIVKEFVSTANYWSARLSTHPLVGGISNIEYGWSESIVNNSLVSAINESTRERRLSATTLSGRPSMQSSLRSSLDQGPGGSISMRARLQGDKVIISDWTPPTQGMRASNLMEPDQLSTLQAYVGGIEEELQKHNQLRSPMLLAFTPRHPNSNKAMANWEKKSSYLLREIVKFTTYIDCLHAAEFSKNCIYEERAEGAPPEGNETTLRPET